MKQLIQLVSDEGSVVLDPFTGSVSTLIAALQLKRKAIGIEINAEYFAIAKARIENTTDEPVVTENFTDPVEHPKPQKQPTLFDFL